MTYLLCFIDLCASLSSNQTIVFNKTNPGQSNYYQRNNSEILNELKKLGPDPKLLFANLNFTKMSAYNNNEILYSNNNQNIIIDISTIAKNRKKFYQEKNIIHAVSDSGNISSINLEDTIPTLKYQCTTHQVSSLFDDIQLAATLIKINNGACISYYCSTTACSNQNINQQPFIIKVKSTNQINNVQDPQIIDTITLLQQNMETQMKILAENQNQNRQFLEQHINQTLIKIIQREEQFMQQITQNIANIQQRQETNIQQINNSITNTNSLITDIQKQITNQTSIIFTILNNTNNQDKFVKDLSSRIQTLSDNQIESNNKIDNIVLRLIEQKNSTLNELTAIQNNITTLGSETTQSQNSIAKQVKSLADAQISFALIQQNVNNTTTNIENNINKLQTNNQVIINLIKDSNSKITEIANVQNSEQNKIEIIKLSITQQLNNSQDQKVTSSQYHNITVASLNDLLKNSQAVDKKINDVTQNMGIFYSQTRTDMESLKQYVGLQSQLIIENVLNTSNSTISSITTNSTANYETINKFVHQTALTNNNNISSLLSKLSVQQSSITNLQTQINDSQIEITNLLKNHSGTVQAQLNDSFAQQQQSGQQIAQIIDSFNAQKANFTKFETDLTTNLANYAKQVSRLDQSNHMSTGQIDQKLNDIKVLSMKLRDGFDPNNLGFTIIQILIVICFVICFVLLILFAVWRQRFESNDDDEPGKQDAKLIRVKVQGDKGEKLQKKEE